MEDACGTGVSGCSLVHDLCVWSSAWECKGGDECFGRGEEGLGDRSPISMWVNGDWNEYCVPVEEVFDDGLSWYGSVCGGVWFSDSALISHVLPLFKFLQMGVGGGRQFLLYICS